MAMLNNQRVYTHHKFVMMELKCLQDTTYKCGPTIPIGTKTIVNSHP